MELLLLDLCTTESSPSPVHMSTKMFDSCFVQFKLEYQEKKLAMGDRISSEVLSAGGHLWRIDCYPRGNTKYDDGQYVSLFLTLLSKSKNVKATFLAFVVKRDGQPSLSHANQFTKVYPSNDASLEDNDWGWPMSAKRSDIEPLYASSGWVTILCGVIVERYEPPQYVEPPSDMEPFDLGSHLGHLLKSTDGADVYFTIGGEIFPCHRAVLAARSPVFKAQLLGSTGDAKMPSITLHDIAAATFKVMLQFIYTDAFPEDDELGDSPVVELFQDLLAASDRYALDGLKHICANKLWQNVSVDTFASILSCAKTYNCPGLKKNCIEFFQEEKNFKKVVLTDGYVQLMQKFPSLLGELREKVGA